MQHLDLVLDTPTVSTCYLDKKNMNYKFVFWLILICYIGPIGTCISELVSPVYSKASPLNCIGSYTPFREVPTTSWRHCIGFLTCSSSTNSFGHVKSNSSCYFNKQLLAPANRGGTFYYIRRLSFESYQISFKKATVRFAKLRRGWWMANIPTACDRRAKKIG